MPVGPRRRLVCAIAAIAAVRVVAVSALSPATAARPAPFRIPRPSTQLLVGIADDWHSSAITLQRFARDRSRWIPVGAPWAARVGPAGLVWGRGLNPVPVGGDRKSEGDGRAPAGVFRVRRAFGFDSAWASRTALDYTTVTPRSLFIDDPSSPDYNRFVELDHDPSTPWEQSQQMKQTDPAHALQVLVEHNYNPSIAGAGSAIFLHIWRRGGTASTAGCTAMDRARLEELVSWLRPGALYVLLPRAEYAHGQADWRLPTLPLP